MTGGGRSFAEWGVLGLLSESPAHPFALARELRPGGALGRVLTVRRPLVYRAVERLVDAGLARTDRREPGESGPDRTVYRITEAGRTALEVWLAEPVEHVRELRLGFLLRLEILSRAGRDPGPLITAQREALRPTLEALLTLPREPDPVDLWRLHNAAAAASFLAALEGSGRPTRPSARR